MRSAPHFPFRAEQGLIPRVSRSELLAQCKKEHPDWTPEQHSAWVEKEMKKEKAYAAEHSNAVRGVEIFSPGEHNGDKYTEQDLDDMIEAFKGLDFRPALKVGHTKDTPGAPAYGFVTNLRKAGGKLVADFESMHDSVVSALKDRRYDRVSSEIYFNLKRGGKMFRRALKAVALLGAEVPAVAGLVPLHKMEFAAEGFDSVAACEQGLEVQHQSIIDALTARVSGLTQQLTEQKENDDMKLKELREKQAALETELVALRAKSADKITDEDRAKIAKFEQDIGGFRTKIDEEIERLTAAEDEGKKLKAQVAELAAKDRAREVTDHVERCTVPSFRSTLEALYRHAVANPEVRVKQFSTDGKGVRTEAELSLNEALDNLVGQINTGAKQLFTVVAGSGGRQARPEGPSGEDAGAEVDAKTQARLRDGKSKTYEEAMDAVLAESPELARRYAEEQSARLESA